MKKLKFTLFSLAIIFLSISCQDQSRETSESYGNPAAEGFNAEGSDAAAIAIADEVMEPNGYRSAIDFFEEFVFVVGRESTDFYRQGEFAYTAMEGAYYAVSTSKDRKAVYASGPRGAVGKIAFK